MENKNTSEWKKSEEGLSTRGKEQIYGSLVEVHLYENQKLHTCITWIPNPLVEKWIMIIALAFM